jgi:hypothetical protein
MYKVSVLNQSLTRRFRSFSSTPINLDEKDSTWRMTPDPPSSKGSSGVMLSRRRAASLIQKKKKKSS